MLPSHNRDALRRADCLAEHAPHAAGSPFVADGEPVAAPESRRERPGLFGVLERNRSREILEQSQTVRHVKRQVPEKVRGSDFQAGEDLRDIQLFPKRQLPPAHHLDGHQEAPLKKVSTKAVTSMFATEIGNSPSQPSRIS